LNSGELSQFTNHWYVTADDGDGVVRVFPGMTLGETETGELSFDGGDALLSLSIGRDELLVFVLDGGELDSEDEEFSGRRHLAFDTVGQIKLPNNTFRFDKDILNEAGTDAPLLPRAVWRGVRPENPTRAPGSIDTSQQPSAAERDGRQSLAVTTRRPNALNVPINTPGSHKKRQRVILGAASAALVCVVMGLVYMFTPTAVTPEQPAAVAQQGAGVETSRQTTVQAANEKAPTVVRPGREQILAGNKSAPVANATEATEATVALEAPEAPEMTAVVVTPPSELIADDISSTPAAAATKPLSQASPKPEVAKLDVPRSEAATPKNTRSPPIDLNPVGRREVAGVNPSQAADQAAAEAGSQREQEQAARLMYERDLLAAQLALAQGRLTQPPEDSAFTLYKQLLASNPESSEARRGFRTLGTALVNRAFAEVAAERWSDARATLAAAAEAGASPNLVADLSGEVAYQQRLADAEAGRFATLHPAEELVALNRTTPPLGRYAPAGIDMVQVEFTISVEGNVQDIEVLGAPLRRLERVVREAVTDWRFEPVRSGTRPIPVRTRVDLEIP